MWGEVRWLCVMVRGVWGQVEVRWGGCMIMWCDVMWGEAIVCHCRWCVRWGGGEVDVRWRWGVVRWCEVRWGDCVSWYVVCEVRWRWGGCEVRWGDVRWCEVLCGEVKWLCVDWMNHFALRRLRGQTAAPSNKSWAGREVKVEVEVKVKVKVKVEVRRGEVRSLRV